MFFEKLFDFIKDDIFWLFSIIFITILILLTFFEIRKLKKCLNNNNISEILRLQKMILKILESKNSDPKIVVENNEPGNINTKEQIKKEEKYSEEEIGTLILDISMELKKTNASLKNWRSFGIFIILLILFFIIKYYVYR